MSSLAFGTFRALAVAALVLVSLQVTADDEDMSSIEGEWVSVTGPQQGKTIVFKEASFGFDAWISWWGRASFTDADGDHGAQVKISGSKLGSDITCLYGVKLISTDGTVIAREMSWEGKDGNSPSCPATAIFRRTIDEALTKFERAMKSGNNAMDKKDYESAITSYLKAKQLNPMSHNAFNLLGDAYYYREDYVSAIQYYSEAIVISGGDPLYYSNRCWAHLQRNENDDAVADGARAIDADPDSHLGFRCRGSAYAELRKYKEAIADLDKAVDLNDGDGRVDSDFRNQLVRKTHTFRFEVCNNTKNKIWVSSIGREDPDSSLWTIRGWFGIRSNKCDYAGVYLNSGGAYYMAYNTDGDMWTGDATRQCVGTNSSFYDAFVRDLEKTYNCDESRSKGFKKIVPNWNADLLRTPPLVD